ncbi:MAG: Arc family DNA-binding protein [Actinobacteria bacterium]|nr:Arc family DNA-binding protein [Actinomycetota bacterium]
MAAITIRNLPDEVVEALKKRAKRNSRSMEAEVRDVVTRVAHGEEVPSRLEEYVLQHRPPRRWSVPGSEVNAWIAANPPTPEQQQTAVDWLRELEEARRIPPDTDEFEDPWEKAARLESEYRAEKAAREADER